MSKRRISSRHLVAVVLLLAAVVSIASGCIVVPAGPAYGGYGYGGYESAPAPAYGPAYGPPVVVAPPPIVFGWGWGGGWRGRRW
jgi:hypothetical protein